MPEDIPSYLSSLLGLAPVGTTLKWAALVLLTVAIVVLISAEQRKMQRYYQRLTSHATSQDTAALDYSLKLLSISARNKLLFSLSFMILTFSIIFYDLKQLHFDTVAALRDRCEPATQAAAPPPPTVVVIKEGGDAVQETTLDTLKRTYEQAFINYYLLHACGKVETSDALVINGALTQEMSTLNAPASLPVDIRQAAKSTYQELYANFDCNNDKVEDVLRQHRQYIQATVTNLSPYVN